MLRQRYDLAAAVLVEAVQRDPRDKRAQLRLAQALRQTATPRGRKSMCAGTKNSSARKRLRELWAYTGKSSVNDAVKRMFSGIAR
jgi:hypothetical protein